MKGDCPYLTFYACSYVLYSICVITVLHCYIFPLSDLKLSKLKLNNQFDSSTVDKT